MKTNLEVNKTNDTKFEIYTGFRKDQELQAKLCVGSSFKNDNESYYKIRLMMFPQNVYYLVKNKDSADRYTVYAKLYVPQDHNQDTNKMTSPKGRFQNPVGHAVLDSKLQSYLEIKFPMLRLSVYMSLYPKK